MLTKRKLIPFSAMAFVALIAVAVSFFRPTQGAQNRASLMRQIEASQEVFIAVEPVEGSPFTIEQVSVKQLSGAAYAAITNNRADMEIERVSLPTFTAVNTSEKTINALGVCVASRSGKVGTFCHIKRAFNLAPDEKITVERNELVEYRINIRQRAPHGQSVVIRGPDKASDFGFPEMWSPGQANDYYLFLINADFTDGSSWMNPAVAAEQAKQRK